MHYAMLLARTIALNYELQFSGPIYINRARDCVPYMISELRTARHVLLTYNVLCYAGYKGVWDHFHNNVCPSSCSIVTP